jgi:putative phosphonate metabolism protein
MQPVNRYAVYYAPRDGAFADRAAAWLGRDAVAGLDLAQPVVEGLPCKPAEITGDPRRYGFHGTIRAPFRPGPGVTAPDVAEAVGALAGRLAPVTLDGLQLENLHGFLALTPEGAVDALLALGAAVVEGTDVLRAALTPDEIARRRPETLTARQRDLLDIWGYPYVMEEFRFHLTLTDRLPMALVPAVEAALAAHFAPVLPRPFVIEDLCLFGETGDGTFRLLHRYALTG